MKVVGDRIYLKLIFFGTALAGKTTALEWLFYHAIPDEMKLVKELRQVKTSFGQTLLFDFAPIEISQNVVTRIFSATGQDYYKGTRTKVLADSDGIFIVVDSQKKALERNQEILVELWKCVEEMENLSEAEIVVLYNKNDLEDIHSMEFLCDYLGLRKYEAFSTCALTGDNLEDALISMLRKLTTKLEAKGFVLDNGGYVFDPDELVTLFMSTQRQMEDGVVRFDFGQISEFSFVLVGTEMTIACRRIFWPDGGCVVIVVAPVGSTHNLIISDVVRAYAKYVEEQRSSLRNS